MASTATARTREVVEVAPFHDPELPFDDEMIGLALLDVESMEAAPPVVELDLLVGSGTFENPALLVERWAAMALTRASKTQSRFR